MSNRPPIFNMRNTICLLAPGALIYGLTWALSALSRVMASPSIDPGGATGRLASPQKLRDKGRAARISLQR
jgi:hypothetical protein